MISKMVFLAVCRSLELFKLSDPNDESPGTTVPFRIMSNRCDTLRESLNSQHLKHFSSLYIFQFYKNIPESCYMTDTMSFRTHCFCFF